MIVAAGCGLRISVRSGIPLNEYVSPGNWFVRFLIIRLGKYA